jgi:hypothetical protein
MDSSNLPLIVEAECFDEFLFPDRVRTRICTLVAEAQHVQSTIAVSRRSEAPYISRPFVPIKAVKEAAVKHGRKLPSQDFQVESIRHNELRLDPTCRGFRARHLEGGLGYIHPHNHNP